MKSAQRRPLNVYVRRGSSAEKAFRSRGGLVRPAEIVPGIAPSPEHDLKYRGGKTIQDIRFLNFYVGYDNWDQDDMNNIDRSLAAAMADQNLNKVMVQYFPGPITSTFEGSQKLPGPAPQVVSQGDVEQLVTTLYGQGTLGGQDLTSTLFNFMLPPGTVLNADTNATGTAPQLTASAKAKKIPKSPKIIVPKDDEDDSLHGVGGYHGSVHVSDTDIVYYAIGVYSQDSSGAVNGIPVFDQPWKNVVATFYHELNEARTDARTAGETD